MDHRAYSHEGRDIGLIADEQRRT